MDVFEPALKKLGQGNLVRFQVGATTYTRDQSRAFDPCFTLCAREGMPFAPALSGFRISNIKDHGPMAGRSLADMALHGCSLVRLWLLNSIRCSSEQNFASARRPVPGPASNQLPQWRHVLIFFSPDSFKPS